MRAVRCHFVLLCSILFALPIAGAGGGNSSDLSLNIFTDLAPYVFQSSF